jgi:hypothetical protein
MSTLKLFPSAKFCVFMMILISGCSSFQPDVPQGTEAYRQSTRVLVQICMPTEFPQDYLSIQQVDRFGSRGEQHSARGSAEKSIGLSASGEPVFELFTHDRPVDLVAVMVDVDNTTYTYDIATVKPTLEGWTSWEAPESQNNSNDMVWYRLANGRAFKKTVPDRAAPKARYRLIRTVDWWSKVGRQNDDRPACW